MEGFLCPEPATSFVLKRCYKKYIMMKYSNVKLLSAAVKPVFTLALLIISISTLHAQLFDTRSTTQKFNAAFQLISMAYVDSVDHQYLAETAIKGMLKELDPHSVYMTKEEIKRANEPLVGNFEGIGVQFQLFKDTIVIISPIPGGPSDKLGIIAGDKIVKINGEEAIGTKINNNYVMERLRGKKGTEVTVSIYRQGRKSLLEFTIIRDKIPLNSIDATYMATSETGYIRLNRFARTTMSEFRDALGQLRSQGMQNLVLDLRNNSGGFLDVSVDLADEFLDRDKMIVYTEGLRSPRQDFKSTSRGNLHKGKVIIMINEGSASASEIVAGAVQDWDRGLVMGRRSFGKGLVQRPFTLPDSSVIRLTTARYYTPSGRSIQKPYDEGIAEYHKDIQKRLDHGEMVYADSIYFPDSLRFLTNNKRVVYGGGGIMPDIFLPIDTLGTSSYYSRLLRQGIINSFTMDYMNKNRRKLDKDFPSFDKFMKDFIVDAEFMENFISYAEKEGIEKDEDGLETSGGHIAVMLKAFIGRNLYDLNAYYKIISDVDKELQQAINTMGDDMAFKNMLVSN
jgi:carboxyl-terminal processing protease